MYVCISIVYTFKYFSILLFLRYQMPEVHVVVIDDIMHATLKTELKIIYIFVLRILCGIL